jgi:hypothetical protein
MGRTERDVVDYIPRDTRDTGTMATIELVYGNDGYTLWGKTLQALGASEGHFLDLSARPAMLGFAARSRVSVEKAEEMMGMFAELGAIDPKLWHGRKIVWSQNLVDRLKRVYQRRGREVPKKPENEIIVHDNPINGHNNPLRSPETPQREVKKRKALRAKALSGENTLAGPIRKALDIRDKLTPKKPKSLAVVRFQEITGTWPNREQVAAIDEVVVTDANLDQWESVVKTWLRRGYRPNGVDGMLDWFRDGIPARGNGGNGKAAGVEAPNPGETWGDLQARQEQRRLARDSK